MSNTSNLDSEYGLGDLAPLKASVPQMPIVFLIDTSGSMYGDRIDEVNRGLVEYDRGVRDSIDLLPAVDVAIVTFGLGGVSTFKGFTQAVDFTPPRLEAGGGTPLGDGIEAALSLLEARKKHYDQSNINRHRGWIVTLSDGQPNDGWEPAAQKLVQAETDRKLTSLPFCIDSFSHKAVMSQLSNKNEPKYLNSEKIVKFFEFIKNSQLEVRKSQLTGQKTAQVDAEDLFEFDSELE